MRDKDGRLWGRGEAKTYSEWRRWVRIGSESESDGCYEDNMAKRYGPLTPVLDADGLPVVAELAKAIAEIAATTIYDPVTLAKACREWMLG